jgi:hypothetical protein
VNETSPQDEFGRRIASRLAAGTAELPRDISERLRAARAQALAARRMESAGLAASVAHQGGLLSLGSGGRYAGWWRRAASALPLLALAVGLIAVNVVQNDKRARELADVDAALLTDTLPPEAYSDPGFLQFLKSGR